MVAERPTQAQGQPQRAPEVRPGVPPQWQGAPQAYGPVYPGQAPQIYYVGNPPSVEARRSEPRGQGWRRAGITGLTLLAIGASALAAYQYGESKNDIPVSTPSSTDKVPPPAGGGAGGPENPTNLDIPVTVEVTSPLEASRTFGYEQDAYTNNPLNWKPALNEKGETVGWHLEEDGAPHEIRNLQGYFAEGWFSTHGSYGNWGRVLGPDGSALKNPDGSYQMRWGTTNAYTVVIDGNGVVDHRAVFNSVTIWNEGTAPDEVRKAAERTYIDQVVPMEQGGNPGFDSARAQVYVQVAPVGLQLEDCVDPDHGVREVTNKTEAAHTFGYEQDPYTWNPNNWEPVYSNGNIVGWHLLEDSNNPHALRNLQGYFGEGWIRTSAPYGNMGRVLDADGHATQKADGNYEETWSTTDAIATPFNGNGIHNHQVIVNSATIWNEGTTPEQIEAASVRNYVHEVFPMEQGGNTGFDPDRAQPFAQVLPLGQSQFPC